MSEEKVCLESLCEEHGVRRDEMATMKKHGFTDGLARKCDEMGVNAKALRDLYYQFGAPCVPILLEFTHKAKPKKAKPEADEKPAKARRGRKGDGEQEDQTEAEIAPAENAATGQ